MENKNKNLKNYRFVQYSPYNHERKKSLDEIKSGIKRFLRVFPIIKLKQRKSPVPVSREKLHEMANLTSVSFEQQQTLLSSTPVNSKQQQDIANSMHNNLEQHQEIVGQALVGIEQPKTVFQTPVNFVINSGQQHGMVNPTTVNFEQRQNVIGLTFVNFGMTSPAVQPSNIQPALSCSSGTQKLDVNKVITAKLTDLLAL
ncbi:4364_t:CDS:2 [Racocetra fulgida]|uniref:4364_t:CDS:1 n=1 Tax=Racocetra fulgida TaxID=60492 RepID=A0A9N9F1C1_9GLOM|nr:4364_t:CDS:2 [Racocetra fulgida]